MQSHTTNLIKYFAQYLLFCQSFPDFQLNDLEHFFDVFQTMINNWPGTQILLNILRTAKSKKSNILYSINSKAECITFISLYLQKRISTLNGALREQTSFAMDRHYNSTF